MSYNRPHIRKPACKLRAGAHANRRFAQSRRHFRHAGPREARNIGRGPRRQPISVSFRSASASNKQNRRHVFDPNSRPTPSAGGWSGRFGEPVTERVKRYTASVGFDRRLADVDIAGSLAHARMLAAVGVLSARRSRRHRARPGDDPRRDRPRRVRVVARPRGRASQHREAADRRSSATPASACTPAARATTRSRPTCACGCAARSTRCAATLGGAAPRVRRSRRAPRRHDHARLHAPAGRAARHVRPSPACLRRDVRARRRAARRLPAARQPAAARRGGARRHELPDRSRARGAGAGLRRPVREFARRGVRSRLRDRIRGGRARW